MPKFHASGLALNSPNDQPMPKTPRKSFQAELERGYSRLNWVIVRIPFDVVRVWGARGLLKVRGEINGFEFRTSLFPTGQGRHVLLVQPLGSNQPRSDNSVGDILLRSKAESICLSLSARNHSHPGPKHDQRHQGAKCHISRIMIAARHGSQGDGDCEREKSQSHAGGQTQQHQRTGG